MVDVSIKRDESSFFCPDCSGSVIASRGFVVCSECGNVVTREYVSPTYQMGEEHTEGSPEASVYGSLGNRMHIVDGLGSSSEAITRVLPQCPNENSTRNIPLP